MPALLGEASLQTRVGIATGVVVVGDLIGTGAAQEQAVVGETPNLAARLQGLAKPNTVVIADSTRRLLGNLFELQDLGAREVKGIAGPVQAWVEDARAAFISEMLTPGCSACKEKRIQLSGILDRKTSPPEAARATRRVQARASQKAGQC
jgi:Adenylate and Guanylate cyclase catalytic domain